MNVNEKLIVEIDAALPYAKDEDDRVLFYVRSQITEKGLERRGEDDQDVSHLREVARKRLENVVIPQEDTDNE